MYSLLADGAVLAEGVPDTDAGLTELAETIGIVRSTFSGVYFDVMAKPDPMGIAYTAEALEPHTDSPCEDSPPGIQLLHCRINTTTGGESTLVDAAAVAEELRSTHRIVHGRLAYDQRTGERHLRGCYTDRGELRSKYRTLRRDSQQADPREQAAS